MITFAFILGLFVGSFLNVVVLRIEKGEGGILKGRSHCLFCGKTLKWFELIPLFSFAIQKGKCRYCRKPISWQYPLVELLTGLLFAAILSRFGLSWQLLFLLPLCAILIVLFVFDLRFQTIPDLVVYLGVVWAFFYSIIQAVIQRSFSFFIFGLISAFALALFFAALSYGSKEKWMGKGDAKLALLTGLILGYPFSIFAILLSFIFGAFVSLVLVLLGKKTLKSQIAFGPFLVSAIFVIIFYGDKIVDWYLRTV